MPRSIPTGMIAFGSFTYREIQRDPFPSNPILRESMQEALEKSAWNALGILNPTFFLPSIVEIESLPHLENEASRPLFPIKNKALFLLKTNALVAGLLLDFAEEYAEATNRIAEHLS